MSSEVVAYKGWGVDVVAWPHLTGFGDGPEQQGFTYTIVLSKFIDGQDEDRRFTDGELFPTSGACIAAGQAHARRYIDDFEA